MTRPCGHCKGTGLVGMAEGDGDPRHGTLNGYKNLEYRCPLCRKANADYWRNRNHVAAS